jgi:hypothetical protein
MSKDYERLCATGETFVSAAEIRFVGRRLVRARGFFVWSLLQFMNKDNPLLSRPPACPDYPKDVGECSSCRPGDNLPGTGQEYPPSHENNPKNTVSNVRVKSDERRPYA